MAFNPNVVFRCGHGAFYRRDLTDALDTVRSRLSSVRASMRHSPYYKAYEDLLDDLEDSRSIRLLDTLKDTFVRSNKDTITHSRSNLEPPLHLLRDQEAIDPSNRVYALLELLDTPTLTLNYASSILEVYSEVIEYCINLSGNLDIIIRAWADSIRTTWREILVDPELRFAVPSWIPVLGDMPFGDSKSRTMARISADSLVGNQSQGIYNAHYGSTANVRFGTSDETRAYSGSFFAKGITLGKVEQVSTRIVSGIVLKECLEMIRASL